MKLANANDMVLREMNYSLMDNIGDVVEETIYKELINVDDDIYTSVSTTIKGDLQNIVNNIMMCSIYNSIMD